MKKVIFMGDQDGVDGYMAQIRDKGWSHIGVDRFYFLQKAIMEHLPIVKMVVLLDGSTHMSRDYPAICADCLINHVNMTVGNVIIVSAFTDEKLNEDLKKRKNVMAEKPSNLGDKLHELSLRF